MASARKLDRRAIGRLSRLRLRARQAVEGVYTGIHKSPWHGFNVEFAEYREYNPGDDLRFLDWRVLARSDRVYIKRFEAETNLACTILLDTSRSMEFTSGGETRLDFGAALAASLALLMLRQGDQVGLVTYDSKVRTLIPPRGNAAHFAAIADALENVRAERDTDVSGVLHEIAERIRRRSFVVVISDFFDDVDRILGGLQHFRHRRHEVVCLHLLDPAELTFPFQRTTLFEGMERGEQVVLDPRVVGGAYRARMDAFLAALKQGCAEKRIDYQRMLTNEGFEPAFATWLARRARSRE